MKFKQFWLFTVLVLLLVSMLAGCGADASYAADVDLGKEAISNEAASSPGLSKPESGTQTTAPTNQKLIRTITMEAETEDMDSLLSAVEARIGELGGYVETRDVYYGNDSKYSYRRASLTIRIPAENLDVFVDQVSKNSNVVSRNETTEDVTLDYVATESRLEALRTEEATLLGLMEKAESLDDLLTIESRLTDVRTEIETVASALKVFDNLVTYGTIHLNIDEVVEYTVVEEEPEGFWEKAGNGISESFSVIGEFLEAFALFTIIVSPFVLILGAIAAVVLITIKLIRKRRKAKKAAK